MYIPILYIIYMMLSYGYVRIGRKSSKLVRAAALKLSQEIAALIERPVYTMVARALEG